jgi:MFS family permease
MLQLLEQQKKLTFNQWKIAGAATLGDMLDFFDFFLIGFVLAFIVKDWNLTYGQSGAILLASGVSAPFGSLFYGWLADKVGRRTALIASILNVSVATGAMAVTPSGAWMYLVFCRFIVGFGVTGLYSVDITLMQEFSPASKRGWFTGITTTMLPAGSLLAALLGAFAAPYIGWRGLVAVGLLPAFLCLYVRAYVPESPHWLIRRGRFEEARKSLAWALSGRPVDDRAADDRTDGRAHAVARTVPIPAQHHRRLSRRPHPNGRRGAVLVDGDAVRDGAEDHPARGFQAGDLVQPVGDRRPVLLFVDFGRVGTPRLGHHQLPRRRRLHVCRRLYA